MSIRDNYEKSEQIEHQKADISQIDEDNIRINNHPYKVIVDYDEGFDVEKLAERYSDVLAKFDYIVGDWGYEQLRLKGFYNDNFSRATRFQKISTVQDYLMEYCNFGCSYFILENMKKIKKSKIGVKSPTRNNNNKSNSYKKRKPNSINATNKNKRQGTKKSTNKKYQIRSIKKDSGNEKV